MESVHQYGDSEFRKLYPTLTESELKEAEANFRRYVALAIDVRRARDAVALEKMRYIGNTPQLPKNGEIAKIMASPGVVGAKETNSHAPWQSA
jgi:hypothetical protein